LTTKIKKKDWEGADRAADFLSIDRDACRRAFHQESEERIREVVQWILSETDLPRCAREEMIEHWAREHGAGLYSQARRSGDLEQVEGILARALFGYHAAA
jgi:hypothetical protein